MSSVFVGMVPNYLQIVCGSFALYYIGPAGKGRADRLPMGCESRPRGRPAKAVRIVCQWDASQGPGAGRQRPCGSSANGMRVKAQGPQNQTGAVNRVSNKAMRTGAGDLLWTGLTPRARL